MKRKLKYGSLGWRIANAPGTDFLSVVAFAMFILMTIIFWLDINLVGIFLTILSTVISIVIIVMLISEIICTNIYADMINLRFYLFEIGRILVLCNDMSVLTECTFDIDKHAIFYAILHKNEDKYFGYEVEVKVNGWWHKETVELDKFLENFKLYEDEKDVPNI